MCQINTRPTGRINVYGVHKEAAVPSLKNGECLTENLYKGQNKEFIELVLFILSQCRDTHRITDLEYFITISYILTPLVSKTLAERLTLDGKDGTLRFMSKQNVNTNILRKVFNEILKTVKTDYPDYYMIYFPENYKKELKDIK